MGSHPYIALPRATTELRLNRVRSEREASQPPLAAAETRPARSKRRISKIVTSEITDHHITVAGEIRGLQQAGIVALRAEWRRLFGSEPPRVSRDLLVRALAYRVQEQSLGGLSRASLKRPSRTGREAARQGATAGPGCLAAIRREAGARMARPHPCCRRDQHRFRLCRIELRIVDADREADHRRSLVGTALLRADERTAHAGVR